VTQVEAASNTHRWLDFSHDPAAFRDTPSARAFAEMAGGDPDAPLGPAR
jgi:hypothetical protein